MKGPDLAKRLRELGFENVKTHMTVLDDADLMQVEARLSASGHKKQAGNDAGAAAPPKKKSLSVVAGEDADMETAPEPLNVLSPSG